MKPENDFDMEDWLIPDCWKQKVAEYFDYEFNKYLAARNGLVDHSLLEKLDILEGRTSEAAPTASASISQAKPGQKSEFEERKLSESRGAMEDVAKSSATKEVSTEVGEMKPEDDFDMGDRPMTLASRKQKIIELQNEIDKHLAVLEKLDLLEGRTSGTAPTAKGSMEENNTSPASASISLDKPVVQKPKFEDGKLSEDVAKSSATEEVSVGTSTYSESLQLDLDSWDCGPSEAPVEVYLSVGSFLISDDDSDG